MLYCAPALYEHLVFSAVVPFQSSWTVWKIIGCKFTGRGARVRTGIRRARCYCGSECCGKRLWQEPRGQKMAEGYNMAKQECPHVEAISKLAEGSVLWTFWVVWGLQPWERLNLGDCGMKVSKRPSDSGRLATLWTGKWPFYSSIVAKWIGEVKKRRDSPRGSWRIAKRVGPIPLGRETVRAVTKLRLVREWRKQENA